MSAISRVFTAYIGSVIRHQIVELGDLKQQKAALERDISDLKEQKLALGRELAEARSAFVETIWRRRSTPSGRIRRPP